jgi:hypothetical protein
VRDILCIEMATRPTLIAVPLLVLLTIFLLFSKPSVAGVLVVDSGAPDYKLVEFIQGHRERMVQVPSSDTRDPLTILKENSGFVEIYDLDKSTDTEIDYSDKSYTVSQYPPDGADPPAPVFYRRTGKRRKFLGYSCEEYRGLAESAKFGTLIDYLCVSSEPPGAKEYIEFDEFDKSKSVKAGDDAPGNRPAGFVLWQRDVDDQGAAEGPDITFIKTMSLPPTVFEPPAGFVKDKNP